LPQHPASDKAKLCYLSRHKYLEDSVTIKQTKLATIRAFTIGFSASLLVLACGGDDNNGDEGNLVDDPAAPAPPVNTVVPDPVQTAPDVTPPNAVVDEGRIVEDCDDNPLLAGCDPTFLHRIPVANHSANASSPRRPLRTF
jgi:hypothetical protein